MLDSMHDALAYIFQTRRRLDGGPRGLDEYTRDIQPTRSLLARANLLATQRQYAIVTGSRGKGSVVAMMCKLLQESGWRVGAVSSPHLVHWNERVRVNGRMIPSADFLRILKELRPHIDALVSELRGTAYLSPQGVFLAIALRHFDQSGVDAAVLEVGRGGRFDDIAAVPDALAVFAPIMLEHRALLGDSLSRIAWHKAGVIKAGGRAISLPQAPEAAAQLEKEAAEQGARLTQLVPNGLANWARDLDAGQMINLRPYGELALPLFGRYQIENASLAIRAAELLAGQTTPDERFRAAVRSGLARVKWHGRVHKLADSPAVFVDGAITVPSARSFVASVAARISRPVIAIVGVPRDRDFAGVYRIMAADSDALIITETDINPSTRFPTPDEAMAAAAACIEDRHYRPDLPSALELAREKAGAGGAIIIAASLMLVGECMLIWDVDTREI